MFQRSDMEPSLHILKHVLQITKSIKRENCVNALNKNTYATCQIHSMCCKPDNTGFVVRHLSYHITGRST